MALFLSTSNRMELLVDQLAEVLARPLASPLAQETIILQSMGMQRWLAMELARRLGVWGNCAYPFPNRFVWDLFKRLLPDLPDLSPFEPVTLTWRVMGLLERFLHREECAELKEYLKGDRRELKRYQLASRIADTFDQYTVFRGDLLAAWEAGEGDNWQALFWRVLNDDTSGSHRSRVQATFLQRLQSGSINHSLLPERLTVFGISFLPVFHLQVLAGLAQHLPVHLFILSPCQEYWGDILPERVRVRLPAPLAGSAPEGNALLASLGRLGRAFSNDIIACGELADLERNSYLPAPEDSLLASLQNDILLLRSPQEPGIVRSRDHSIRFEACHSPLREVEVLHDQLLEMFQQDPQLKPRDVLVMTPDIESFAPVISAVFDGNRPQPPQIPYSIADRTIRSAGQLSRTLLALLELPGSRFGAPAVMDILRSPPVCRSFALADPDLELVRRWLDETAIRWGMDRQDREGAGLAPYRDNTWAAGLERLLLGYAMPPRDNLLFDGILPYDAMEGDAPLVLGKLVTFVTQLHQLITRLNQPHTLSGWSELLLEVLDRFFMPDEEELQESLSVRAALQSLGSLEEAARFGDRVGRDILLAWLRGRLDNEVQGSGFISGGVTFCAMLPMRSIPFKVIALIGMNDGAFPRQNRPPGFDLIGRYPRPGDRSLRDEDRYLFLESILSARQRLYISYTGQSLTDNSPLPPSVLVSELMDYLERHYRSEQGELLPVLITRHRLQPFCTDYFTGQTELFSYSLENCRAVAARRDGNCHLPPFFGAPLSEPSEELRLVNLGDLLRFYRNPAAYLLATRLGLRLEEPSGPLSEREPFQVESLDAYGIKQELVSHLLGGGTVQELLPLVRARGILPPGLQGERLFAELALPAGELATQVEGLLGDGSVCQPLAFDLPLAGFRLHGSLESIRPERLLRYRCARLTARDQARLWIEHLLLNLLDRPGYPRHSTLVMLDNRVDLQPVAAPALQLQTLLELYWQGLTLPLPFFPGTSLAYARKGSLEQAGRTWRTGHHPECDDPCYQLCFGNRDPLDEEFARVAVAVFGEYLHHCGACP